MPAETVIEKAQAQVDRAKADLTAALEAGSDTSRIRSDLKGAETRLATLKAESTQAPAPAASVFDPAPEANALVNDAADQINSLVHVLAEVQRPTPLLDEQAARNLVEARHRHAEAQQAQAEHQTRIAALQDRLAALDTRRSAIAAERAAGIRDDERQGGELALIALDSEALQDLLTRAQAEAPNPLQAAAEVRAAELAWVRAVDRARAVTARELARVLQDQLLAAIREHDSLPFNERLTVDPDIRRRVTTRGGKW